MGVDYRGADVAVTEQLLTAADVHAGVEPVGPKRVAQRVGRHRARLRVMNPTSISSCASHETAVRV